MDSNILKSCKIIVKEPLQCTESEIDKFHELVLKGRKVDPNGLLNRIRNCEFLAFCYLKDNIIGISAIKKPSDTYIERVINSTKIQRQPQELNFEIGYSFTEPDFRRNGISKTLKECLLNAMKSRSGIIFSTTAIKSSQTFLIEQGFEQKGEAYDGDNDKGIMYLEKEIRNPI